MHIQIASDLHLEFGHIDLPIAPQRDLLILAGDIGVGKEHTRWMNVVCDHGPVVYMPGNHEYYNNDYNEIEEYWSDFNHLNFEFLQCKVIKIGGFRIAGCTLWTDMNNNDWYAKQAIRKGMNDFHVIKIDGQRFHPDDAYNIHQKHRAWLMEQRDIDIVVTHHAPSYQSVTKHWEGHFLNPAFAANCNDVIEYLKPRYWIHGHMHSFLRYWYNGIAGGTEVICNPRGYAGQYQERTNWKPEFTVEV